MSTAASRNELNGGSIQRVTLYDSGGSPSSSTNPVPFTPTVTALTAMSPGVVVLTATTGAAVGSLGTRKGLTFINTDASANVISLGLGGATAVLYSGITLYPGGSFSMDNFSFDTGAVSGIGSASGARLSVQQWTT